VKHQESGARAAIYARMSTDKQSADSPADQIARCREYAAREGLHVVEDLVRTDAGISGASRHNRPGLLELIARIDEWDVLLCFDSSRLARDGEDLGWIRNRLRIHKRCAVEVSTGLDLENVGSKVMGVLNEEYLAKLRLDIRRGMRGRAERGLSAGGRPFGYRTKAIGSGRFDSHGTELAAGYRLAVDDAQAAVVQSIFEWYVEGDGLRAIAHRLNREGAPCPRPRRNRDKPPSWSAAALRKMLLNPIYKGDLIWNRVEWIKDHETGKRVSFDRPPEEWVQQHDDELAIVSPELWERAQRAREERRKGYEWKPGGGGFQTTHAGPGRRVRSRYLFSGLLACGECGGGFFAVTGGGRVFGCGWHRDRGNSVCRNAQRVDRVELEERVLTALRDHVLTPENVAYAVDRAVALVAGACASPIDHVDDRRRLAEIAAESENATRLAVRTGNIEPVLTVLGELRAEREEIEQRLATAPIALDPESLRPRAEAMVREIRQRTAEGDVDTRRRALRSLIEKRLRVSPDPARGFRVEGVLAVELGVSPLARQPSDLR
jgi:site-specific DNA recombinase